MQKKDSLGIHKKKLEKDNCKTGCKCEGGGSDACSKIVKFLFSQTKYLFYYLEIVLVPCHFYRFFFKYGDYSSNAFLKLLIALIFVGMAYWSHARAGPPNDPGYVQWEDFRSEEELKDVEDKKKWEDPSYAQKK